MNNYINFYYYYYYYMLFVKHNLWNLWSSGKPLNNVIGIIVINNDITT